MKENETNVTKTKEKTGMSLIKIGMANIDTNVGAIDSNLKKIVAFATKMAEEKCTFGVFQEQTLAGYPPEDLPQWQRFVDKQKDALVEFAKKTKELPFKTTYIIGTTIDHGGNLYNCASVIRDGEILGLVPKEKLPTYGIFYEGRVFAAGTPGQTEEVTLNEEHANIPFGDIVFDAPSARFGLEICEDVWSPDGPMRRRAYSDAELIFNISASPFRSGVVETRREMLKTRSADNEVALVYVSQVGGQDALVFDGGGFVCQNGRLVKELERWNEKIDYQVINLDTTRRRRKENSTWRKDHATHHENKLPTSKVISIPEIAVDTYPYPVPRGGNFFMPESITPENPRTQYFEDLLSAMKTGLAGYFEKTGAFDRIGIAFSGGKDSALTLLVARMYAENRFKKLEGEEKQKAIKDFIHCFSMPTRFNSDATKNIARDMSGELGVTFREVPIQEAFEREATATQEMVGDEKVTPLTLQNIQARIRGERMWNWSNNAKGLWLQTGNMSEKAVGYTTIGGDLMGGYSLIGNMPKTVVIGLLEHLSEKYQGNALNDLLQTKASAELAADQEDERDLMPFPVLDACFALFAGEKLSPDEIKIALRDMWNDKEYKNMQNNYKPEMINSWVDKFTTLFTNSIYKWEQAPQSVHLGSLDLDRTRALQIPVVFSKEWLLPDKNEKGKTNP